MSVQKLVNALMSVLKTIHTHLEYAVRNGVVVVQTARMSVHRFVRRTPALCLPLPIRLQPCGIASRAIGRVVLAHRRLSCDLDSEPDRSPQTSTPARPSRSTGNGQRVNARPFLRGTNDPTAHASNTPHATHATQIWSSKLVMRPP